MYYSGPVKQKDAKMPNRTLGYEFSQHTASRMFANEDPELRDRLRADVKAFEAKGGKITKAARGETGYMGGKEYLRRYRPRVNEDQA